MAELWQAWLRFLGYRRLHRNRGARTVAVASVVLLTLALYLVAAKGAGTVIEGGLLGLEKALGLG